MKIEANETTYRCETRASSPCGLCDSLAAIAFEETHCSLVEGVEPDCEALLRLLDWRGSALSKLHGNYGAF